MTNRTSRYAPRRHARAPKNVESAPAPMNVAAAAEAAAHQLTEALVANGVSITTVAHALILEGAALLAVSGANAAAISIVTDLALADTDSSYG